MEKEVKDANTFGTYNSLKTNLVEFNCVGINLSLR